ncbi:MAG: phosphoglycerate dehydrogenase [Sphaerochaetaceae bacterium]|nr:phosphoglycerate dehydrogenase [Sphaerochaetaceae bacterium]MDD3163354.1 phosphoglycerate dehydrogenase [Sphaerochaetaceae bacterium]MDD4396820.1 phosphoglycerate dehydrogenase [Sphaerochaetaceae bacterium]
MEIFVTSKSFAKNNPGAETTLAANGFSIRRSSCLNPSTEQISKEIGNADVLLVGNDVVNSSVFDNAPNLKLVVMHGTGLDGIDIKAASMHGIMVANAPGANRNAVAEMAVGLMLTVGRRIDKFEGILKSGKWERSAGHEVSGSTVGILGLGNIGKRVVELLSGFEVKIVAFDPFEKSSWVQEHNVLLCKNEDDVFKTADFLVLTVPLTKDTEKIVNSRTLALMKPNAYVINIARGGLIDESALCAAIDDKKIAGAALDTFAEEPLPVDSPLRKLDIVLTPHIAATSIETSAKVSAAVAEIIVDIMNNKKINLAVNSETLQKR